MDERVFMPGFRRARRYLAADPQTRVKYFATYETESVGDLCAPDYMRLLGEQSPWSQSVMARFTHFDRLTLSCTVDLAHGVAGAAGLPRFAPAEADRARLRTTLRDTVLPELVARPGMLGACLLENDLEVMNAGLVAQGKPVPTGQRVDWVVILDAMTAASAGAALEAGFGGDRLAGDGAPTASVETGRYHFVFGNQR